MHSPHLDIIFHDQLGSLDPAMISQLLIKLFAPRSEVQRVEVAALPGSSMGMSNIGLLLATAQTNDGVQQNPIAVRIGKTAAIRREYEHFQRLVEPYLGFESIKLKLTAWAEPYSALGYEYLERSSDPPRTLRDVMAYERKHTETIEAIELLFHETLVHPVRPKNGWCGDVNAYAEQTPLWFYNLVLPPTLTLSNVRPAAAALATDHVFSIIRAADRPGAETLRGLSLALASNEAVLLGLAPDLPEDQKDGRVMMRCLLRWAISQPDAAALVRPLDPIIARIELHIARQDVAAVQAAIEAGYAIEGTIAETRYARLHDLITRHTLRPSSHSYGQPLALGSIPLLDPLTIYADVLERSRLLHTCIIHGDLNMGNVLIRRRRVGNAEADLSAWLIDFDRTMPGGHAVFDFVKLETEYKCQILPFKLRRAEDVLRLEEALHRALFNPDSVTELLGNDSELKLAYNFIAALRRMALYTLPAPRPSPGEYYLGLLANSLATLKYRNLYPPARQHWIQTEARIEPLAQVAYLSASFIAAVVDQVATLTATAASYPPMKPGNAPERLRLLGRDRLLSQIERQLDAGERVAMLYGVAGSGRDMLAAAISIGLVHSGYLAINNPLETTGLINASIEDVLSHLLGMLEFHGVAHLPTLSERSQRADVGYRRALLKQRAQQLAAALDADERRFVLSIALQRGDHEHEQFAIELAQHLRRSIVLITANRPLNVLPARAQFAVERLSLTDLQAYNQYEQLRLDAHALQTLYDVSDGLPGLLMPLLRQLGNTRTSNQISDVLAQLPVDAERSQFAQELLKQQPPVNRALAELDALLRHYSAAEKVDLVALAAVAVLSGRIAVHQVESAVQAYVEVLSPIYSTIAETALGHLEGKADYQRCCMAAADYYAQQSPTPQHLVARYALLSGDWARAEAVVLELVDAPDRAYRLPRRMLLQLIEDLLKHDQVRERGRLHALAGATAAFLSNYAHAVQHYEWALIKLSGEDDLSLRLLAALLDVHQAKGDTAAAEAVAAELRSRAPTTAPIRALAEAHAAHVALNAGDLPQAGMIFAASVQHLQDSRAQWGADYDYFREQMIRLTDMLARTEAGQGRTDQAIRLITEVQSEVRLLHDHDLTAMIENDLAAFYFMRGKPRDHQRAKQIFRDVFERRQKLGNWIGTIRTGQNLAVVTTELAQSATDWVAAEEIYTTAEELVERVQDFDATQIYANHLELLSRRGDHGRAAAYQKKLNSNAAYQRGRGQLNAARIALNQADAPTASQILAALAPLFGTMKTDLDQRREWAGLCLEVHLRFGLAYDPLLVAAALVNEATNDPAPLDVARLSFSTGLLACAEADYPLAQTRLARAEQLWSQLGFQYMTAVAAAWQGFTALRADDYHTAMEAFGRAITILTPFGATPMLELVQAWQANHGEPGL